MKKKQFFGEFLVERQLITENDLVMALIKQINSTPSILEAAYNENLLDANTILEAVKIQFNEDCDIKLALNKLNKWNEEVSNKIKQVQKNNRIPIGETLVLMKKIDFNQLVEALDDFVYEVAKDEANAEVVEKFESEENNDSAPTPSSKKLEANFCDLEPTLVENLLASFSLQNIQNLGELNSTEDVVKIFQEIIAAARFVKAEITSQLGQQILQFIEADARNLQHPLYADSIALFRELQKSIENSNSEKPFWNANQDQFNNIFYALEKENQHKETAACAS